MDFRASRHFVFRGSGDPVAKAIHATRQENPMPRHKLLRLAKFSTFLLLIALWTSAAPIDAQVEKGFDVDVHANDMLGWFSAKTYAETVALSKIIVDKATDRILGAHFVGHEGQELINVFGLAIKFGLTAHQLKDNVYAYPTFSSDIKHMFGHA
jgi:hypothetical protein